MGQTTLEGYVTSLAEGDDDAVLFGVDVATGVRVPTDTFATQTEVDALVISGGGISVASDAEAKTATNNTKAMTPAKVKVALPFVTLHPSGDTTGATDLAAINAAIAAAANVRLAPGTFYINGTITLASSKTLSGSGRDATTIYCASGSNPADGMIGYAVGSLSNITISDLTLDANKAGNTGTSGIVLTVCTNTTVERCRIKNTSARGIHTYQGSNFSALHNDFVDIGDANTSAGEHGAILCQDTLGTRIHSNRVDGCTDSGIITSGDGANSIVGNHVEDCYFIGIGLGGGHTATGGPHVISGNTVKTTTASNLIDTGDACNVTVQGNTLMGAAGGEAGICHDASGQASAVANLTIVGNSIYDCAGGGIVVVGNQTTPHSGFTVTGNTINVVGNHGINPSGFRRGTISGNTIRQVANGFAFIRLTIGSSGAAVTDVAVTGNSVYDPTPHGYAVHSDVGNDWNIITANNFRTASANFVGTFGANSITTGNLE
jgi:hypothetical protein